MLVVVVARSTMQIYRLCRDERQNEVEILMKDANWQESERNVDLWNPAVARTPLIGAFATKVVFIPVMLPWRYPSISCRKCGSKG